VRELPKTPKFVNKHTQEIEKAARKAAKKLEFQDAEAAAAAAVEGEAPTVATKKSKVTNAETGATTSTVTESVSASKPKKQKKRNTYEPVPYTVAHLSPEDRAEILSTFGLPADLMEGKLFVRDGKKANGRKVLYIESTASDLLTNGRNIGEGGSLNVVFSGLRLFEKRGVSPEQLENNHDGKCISYRITEGALNFIAPKVTQRIVEIPFSVVKILFQCVAMKSLRWDVFEDGPVKTAMLAEPTGNLILKYTNNGKPLYISTWKTTRSVANMTSKILSKSIVEELKIPIVEPTPVNVAEKETPTPTPQ
jgi:hypothetical protein